MWRSAMDGMVSPSSSYVAVPAPRVTVFGGRAFRRLLEVLGRALLPRDCWLQSRAALSSSHSLYASKPSLRPSKLQSRQKTNHARLGHPSVGDRPHRLGQESLDFLHSKTDLLRIMIPVPFKSLYLLLFLPVCPPPPPGLPAPCRVEICP